MQRVWVCDAPFVGLLFQEVKEVFDSQRGAIWRDAEDGLKEVIQELLQSSLRGTKEKKEKAAHVCCAQGRGFGRKAGERTLLPDAVAGGG